MYYFAQHVRVMYESVEVLEPYLYFHYNAQLDLYIFLFPWFNIISDVGP